MRPLAMTKLLSGTLKKQECLCEGRVAATMSNMEEVGIEITSLVLVSGRATSPGLTTPEKTSYGSALGSALSERKSTAISC